MAEPFKFVRVKEAGDLVTGVLADAAMEVGAARASVPLLGAEHHRAQDLKGPVGRAGALPAGGINQAATSLRPIWSRGMRPKVGGMRPQR